MTEVQFSHIGGLFQARSPRAKLRRPFLPGEVPLVEIPAESSHRVRFGEFELDLLTRELWTDEREISLQEQPFQILAALLERPGQLVTRDKLTKKLWPNGTFVDFGHSLNTAVNRLRAVLEDSAERPRFIECLPRRGYRFIAPVASNGSGKTETSARRSASSSPVYEWSCSVAHIGSEGAKETGFPQFSRQTVEKRGIQNKKLWEVLISALAALSAAIVAAGLYYRSHSGKQFNHKDTIVLADFANKTDDVIFDGTLRQGLSVQLEQSPFLNIISDERIQTTLSLMGQPAGTKLTWAIARELCQRTGSAAVLDGSIGQIGTQYLLTLRAVSCASGESLASAEARARDKNHVLDALGRTASDLRQELGESLSTTRRFNTPLEQATTPSLEALQSYSLGRTKMVPKGDNYAAVPLFQRAIQLDPTFAMAYASLGTTYFNLGEDRLGADNTKNAYELRKPLSQRERFYIEAHYCDQVTGDLEKARQLYELWEQIYPNDYIPPDNIAGIYTQLGEYERALEEDIRAFHADPVNASNYADRVADYIYLNAWEAAQTMAEQALSKKLDSPKLRSKLYVLAFLRNDTAEMERQVSWGAGKPGVEDILLALHAETAACVGHLTLAREFSRRAVIAAQSTGEKETAATYEAFSALRESLIGNSGESRQRVSAALRLSTGRDVQAIAALTLSFTGNIARSQVLANDLANRFPEDTIVQFNYLPTIRAQLALDSHDPTKAIEAAQAAASYELGNQADRPITLALWPIYVRGQAYLAARQGDKSAAEFRKILDHRGVVQNEPIGVLAHLGLARAHRLQGHTAKARAAYQDFFTLWKNSDPDIPILKQAKAEYERLR